MKRVDADDSVNISDTLSSRIRTLDRDEGRSIRKGRGICKPVGL
ncbi:hypothetical protein ACPOL_4947 [Acidisarcina polymorpha]|uniref:Uncharacterized protein n=1 Tax=Acidisarcina polymorpha TaxID=2211140 RepID=A0A2Z5G5J1_9BACT|nr:hypothetical protein ACPOL_4947 [Acidisarcina polymorpha]